MPDEVVTHRHVGPVGQCIYCLSEASDLLTDEHIIPYSLDGTLLLTEASCTACNKVTSAFELSVARKMMGAMRLRHKFPSRNRKKRLGTLPVKAVFLNGDHELAVPIEDFAAYFPVLWFQPPGIMVDRDPSLNVSIRGEFWRFSSELTAKSIGAEALAYGGEFDFIAFARMLAKIGHAFAVAQLGVDGFAPTLLDIIHKRYKRLHDVWHFIGGEPQTSEPRSHDIKTTLHELQLYHYSDVADGIITCQVRLFSTLKGPEGQGMPIYEIVVGHFNKYSSTRLEAIPYYPYH